MTQAKKHALRGVAEIDHSELTVRLLEIGCKIKRPVGATGHEALTQTRQMARDGKIPAYIVRDFEDMATAAIEYLGECVKNMKAVQ